MKTFKTIVATAVSLFTLWMVVLTACCLDLAFVGYWPVSWQMYLRAMDMNHVSAHQYLQGLNATCVVVGVLATIVLVRFSFDLFKDIRR